MVVRVAVAPGGAGAPPGVGVGSAEPGGPGSPMGVGEIKQMLARADLQSIKLLLFVFPVGLQYMDKVKIRLTQPSI